MSRYPDIDEILNSSGPVGARLIGLHIAAKQARDELARVERDLKIVQSQKDEMRDALESIWSHWYAGNVSVERAMEEIRLLFVNTV